MEAKKLEFQRWFEANGWAVSEIGFLSLGNLLAGSEILTARKPCGSVVELRLHDGKIFCFIVRVTSQHPYFLKHEMKAGIVKAPAELEEMLLQEGFVELA